MTAQEPQKKAGVPHVVAIPQAVEECPSFGILRNRCRLCSNGSAEKKLGSLHHPEPGIPGEPAHRHLQEGAGWQVVTVEDGDQIPVAILRA